ncbi:MOXD1 homolog 1-like [Physella acuta]|uniref:MOXD1 homolog 1-like n=1 Tax=Physella acuta TaxID=109671 RepID=UPI0027DB10FB|nr:MOXD1 homolog 1-like [Physella acuta]
MIRPQATLTACLLALTCFQLTHAYKRFQELIPNGARVFSPCCNQTWPGVGHKNKDGGSHRNPFGVDFYRHKMSWTKELCQTDSDGDGRTNGEELGDPDCTWTKGKSPKKSSDSHPGICEPLNSPKCQKINHWLNCEAEAADMKIAACPHIQSPGVMNISLRMTETPVPPAETTYFCQLFDLDLKKDMHMIATTPLVEATEVVHHVLLFGCTRQVRNIKSLQSPYPCEMVPHSECRSLIGAWTMRSPGECAHRDMGFRMGPGGYMTVALQVHWNNPDNKANLMDRSGLMLYLTDKLRPYDAGMLVVGQDYVQVDPVKDGQANDLEFLSSCPGRCTTHMFTKPIQITSAVNHMHYLGKSQHIKVYRNNTKVQVITDQEEYLYDDPKIYNFHQPIRVEPGDEIRTSCTYKRTPTKEPVCWGEATSDEMCFGFITYFPVEKHLSHPWCTSTKSLSSCDRQLPALRTTEINGCKWWEFRNLTLSSTRNMFRQVLLECYNNTTLKCTETCRANVTKVLSHECLQGDMRTYMLKKFKELETLDEVRLTLEALMTCSCQEFEYCERKSTTRLYGRLQEKFCSSASCENRISSLVLALLLTCLLILY